MPTYRYECSDCGHGEEVVQKITADPLERCPVCGGNGYRRVLFATGFILKGSGWYKTDYAGGGRKGDDRSVADKKEKQSGEGGDSSSNKADNRSATGTDD